MLSLLVKSFTLHTLLGIQGVSDVQRSANVDAPLYVNFVPALTYHFCLNLPEAFTQPGASTLADLCIFMHLFPHSAPPLAPYVSPTDHPSTSPKAICHTSNKSVFASTLSSIRRAAVSLHPQMLVSIRCVPYIMKWLAMPGLSAHSKVDKYGRHCCQPSPDK